MISNMSDINLEDIDAFIELLYSSYTDKRYVLSGRDISTFFINDTIFREMILYKINRKYYYSRTKSVNVKEQVSVGKSLESAAISMFMRNHPEYSSGRILDNFNNKYTVAYKFDNRNNVKKDLIFVSNPDIILLNKDGSRDALCEIKVSNFLYGSESKYYNVPLHMLVQLNWDLGFHGLKKGYLAGYRLGYNVKYFEIEYSFDEELFKNCLGLAKKIYSEYLVLGEKATEKLYKDDVNVFLNLYKEKIIDKLSKTTRNIYLHTGNKEDIEIIEKVVKYNFLRNLRLKIEKEEENISMELKNKYDKENIKNVFIIKDKKGKNIIEQELFSLTLVNAGGLDTKRLEFEHPEIYNSYYNDSYKSYLKMNVSNKGLEFVEKIGPSIQINLDSIKDEYIKKIIKE